MFLDQLRNMSSDLSSHTVFSKVDDLVSKPVIGSDGAASWQTFHKDHKSGRSSAAPRAPLKKSDKLGTGFSNWAEEEANEAKVRKSAGHSGVHSGYTNFRDKDTGEEAAELKKTALVESRTRPEEKEYFISSSTFQGWKFDYIFTTRKNWGTGYFWDGMDSIKKMRGQLPEEGDGASSADAQGDKRTADSSESGGKPKKKKRKKKAGPVIVEDPNNPRAQLAAVMQRRAQALHGVVADPTLPPGWEAAADTTSKKTYYYNRKTGERSWEKPAVAQEVVTGEDNAKDKTLPSGWSEAKDATSGKIYYYHTDGKTSWEKPVA